MGVMSCSRYGCENIMCDTYVDGVGYVCYDCQKEFEKYLKKKGLNPETEGQIKKHLKDFMETEKDEYVEGKEMDVDEFFRSYTRNG